MPVYTPANVAEIGAGAGQLPTSPETAAPASSPAEIAAIRQPLVDALASQAAFEKIPAERLDAWKAERLAKIDKDTNYTPPDPIAAAEAVRADAHQIAIDAQPENYNVEWPASFLEAAKNPAGTTGEMRQFAADLKLPAGMGVSLLVHLAQIAPQYKGLSEDQAVAHRVAAEAALVATFGSQEAADAKVAEARAGLAIAKDNKLAAALGQSLQILDPMVIAILAGHSQRHALFQKGGKP